MVKFDKKFQLRMPIDLYTRLMIEADSLDISMSELCRLKLRDWVIMERSRGN